MKFKDALGIDVSKNTIDVHLLNRSLFNQFENSNQGFKRMIKWVEKQSTAHVKEIMICFEHTGLYSLQLSTFLSALKVEHYMLPALEIKRSLGITRGKDDKIDAKRIAEYAYLRRANLKPSALPSANILKLQKLIALRENLVKQKAGYMASHKEYKSVLKIKDYPLVFKVQMDMIASLKKGVSAIEKEIQNLIMNDDELHSHYQLITSVKGIGFILAINLLVTTHCFTRFTDGRKFACYAGLAPFKYQSGTSLNSKAKVSHLANKKMKALLNLAAFSAIQNDPELKLYYHRRVNSGKSKMSTINIVRNKIVHRVFAVVKRGTPFVHLNKHAA